MENIICKQLSFTYATSEYPALSDVSFQIDKGELCLVIGKSAAGKSTMLKLLKREIAPVGNKKGELSVDGSIGYVSQNVEESIVTDKVRSELSFGLTNLGYDKPTIELMVAETASYFNLSSKLDESISSLSGGEKHLLNLASVMIMNPSVLVLDEPTCQLDPVSAQRFISMIKKLHEDFGITIIIAEHLLEELFPYADSIMLFDSGKMVAKLPPLDMIDYLRDNDSDMLKSIPIAMSLFCGATSVSQCREKFKELNVQPLEHFSSPSDVTLKIKNLSFAYRKNEDVLNSLNYDAYDSSINVILGANSSGKTTLLKVACGVLKHHHGKIKCDKKISMLCQNPFDLFTKERCCDEVEFGEITDFLEIGDIANQHPYDLSGGQAQRLALAKVLHTGADVILLDEPTKALDSAFKAKLGEKLKELCSQGKTIIITTHDIDFVGEYGDYVSFLSGGEIITTKPRAEFFDSMSFYTTSVSRITKGIASGYSSLADLKAGGII